MKYILSSLIVLFLSACGYTPSAKFARVIVGDSISTGVVISAVDPENTVIIKDGIDRAVYEVFHASLVSRKISNTHLQINLSNPSYSPIQYDSDGFVVSYRTTVRLKIQRDTKNQELKNYHVKGTYDFSITPNALISDQQRFDAIRFSAVKAIKSFVAQMAAEGIRTKEIVNSKD